MFIEKIVKFTPEQLDDFVFAEVYSHIDNRKRFWIELDDYFNLSDVGVLSAKIESDYCGLWRYYVKDGWSNLDYLSDDKITNFVAWTFVDAAKLGIGLTANYISYLGVQCFGVENRVNIFLGTKRKVEECERMFYGKSWGSLYKKILKYINPGNADSLENANILAGLVVDMYSGKEKEDVFYFDDKERALSQVISFVSFLNQLDPDLLQTVIYSFIEPDVVNAYLAGHDYVGDERGGLSIKEMINLKFLKTQTGEYEDIDGVMSELDRLATETGDDTIRDLYYFNESTGKFEWKE